MRRTPIVYANLPKAGLGNKLYIWARAAVIAQHLSARLAVSAWSQLPLGTFLRRERRKRIYWRQLRASHYRLRAEVWWKCHTGRSARHTKPIQSDFSDSRDVIVVDGTHGTPPDDSFRDLKYWRSFLRSSLLETLYPAPRRAVEHTLGSPIGIHVRRGDFRCSDWFTPIEYYCARLQNIRQIHGGRLCATVFTDGTDIEIAPLLEMTDVAISPPQSDIVDLFALSKCRLIITSGASTFSSWASFLSDGVVIRHPRWPHAGMRPEEMGRLTYEGSPSLDLQDWPELLVQNIKALSPLPISRLGETLLRR